MIHGVHPCEFPHSEISGSLAMCAYPKLIAAYHVLHRLLMPRHSPCALCSLTYLVNSKLSQFWFSQRIVFNKYFISWLVVSTIYIIMCNFQRTFWKTMVSQNWTEFTFQTFFSVRNPRLWIFCFQQIILFAVFSIERRWSSRRFSYGYLVTTSPQSLTLP